MTNKMPLIEYNNHVLVRVELGDNPLKPGHSLVIHEFWISKDEFEESLNLSDEELAEHDGSPKCRVELGMTDEEAIALFKELNGI